MRHYAKKLLGLTALLVLILPLTGWAQFTVTTNNGVITITGYSGPGGNLTIPSTINNYPVVAIGDFAFYSKATLTGVTIPNTVTNIGLLNFASCPGLTNIAVNIANMSYASVDGVLLNKNLTTLIRYPEGLVGSYAILNSVTTIGDYSFAWCTLTAITIPSNVTNIGTQAFANCSGLTNMTFPSSVTRFGSIIFVNCPNLRQVYFLGSPPSIAPPPGGVSVTVFYLTPPGTVYYVPGITGWSSTFGGWNTAGWYQPRPKILSSGYGIGVQSNRFQFTISWATNAAVVVEASTNLQNWTPIITNTLVNGTSDFNDSTWTNYLQRFYRVHSQ